MFLGEYRIDPQRVCVVLLEDHGTIGRCVGTTGMGMGNILSPHTKAVTVYDILYLVAKDKYVF